MKIIQLENADGHAMGLYAYNPNVHSENEAVHLIEQAFDDAREADDPQGDADEALAKLGIERTFAAPAVTDVL